MMNQLGQIIRSHGRRFTVESGHEIYECTTRGKRADFVCGDWVDILVQNKEQAVIQRSKERRTLLCRQDEWKTKLIAANVTQILFVIAAVPTPNKDLLGRCLISAEAGGMKPVVIVNKTDLQGTVDLLRKLELHQKLGYPVITVSAQQDVAPIRLVLQDQTSIFVGQSGMGKSTLTNALLPSANARIGHISTALDAGRHTTTHATLHHLNADSHLIDSPGLQSFGLRHLKATELTQYFPEMRPLIGQCRFHNCSHRVEPDCAIMAASKTGAIAQSRLSLLQRLTNELAPPKS